MTSAVSGCRGSAPLIGLMVYRLEWFKCRASVSRLSRPPQRSIERCDGPARLEAREAAEV